MTIIFRYTISPKIDSPIDAPVTDLRKKINISISSLTNITSNPSDKHVTNGVIPDPPISSPWPDEFKKGEKYEGDVTTHVDKWHKDLPDVDEHSESIESEDIFPTESIVDLKVKANSPNQDFSPILWASP